MTQPKPSPSAPIPDRYEPAAVEERWYPEWEKRGYFRADPESTKPPYCIVIPPPNVTGSLHIGHALDHTLIDALVRRRRMQGYNTLWLPGMDHAGIATQNVVERELAKEGLSRHDLGREAFVERVWQWKAESGGKMICGYNTSNNSVASECVWATTTTFGIVEYFRHGQPAKVTNASALALKVRDAVEVRAQ